MSSFARPGARTVKLANGGRLIVDRVEQTWRAALYAPREQNSSLTECHAAKSDDLLDVLVRCLVPGYPSRVPDPADWRRAREIADYLEAMSLEMDEPSAGKSEGSSQNRKEVALSGRDEV